MGITEILKITGIVLSMLLSVCYLYQVVYLFIPFFKKEKSLKGVKQHKFAFLIAARNEEEVLPHLLYSIRAQDYPPELLSVFVVADNCTDRSFDTAVEAGAIVYRRENKEQIGKGYALNFLLEKIDRDYGCDCFDGFFVFDADNLLDEHYIEEMNKTFDQGYRVLTSYRNSKNYDTNWISAGYSLWFLRESKYLNNPRMMLHTSCAISGTGFLISSDIIREQNGWKYHLLTEDIEFSIDHVIQGETIGYCGGAMLYDEQPTTFEQSWNQRLRWSKGFYQVNAKYSLNLVRGFFKKPRRSSWSCYDMFMTVAPGMLLTLVTIAFNLVVCLACLGQPMYIIRAILDVSGSFMLSTVSSFYFGLLLYGLLTVLCEWKQIQIPNYKKILYVFTFPLFMFTYIPISLAALVRKVEWKPIYHTGSQKTLGKAA